MVGNNSLKKEQLNEIFKIQDKDIINKNNMEYILLNRTSYHNENVLNPYQLSRNRNGL